MHFSSELQEQGKVDKQLKLKKKDSESVTENEATGGQFLIFNNRKL